MLCDEGRNFSDVFFETSEVIHRQVEHQIRFHSSPREPLIGPIRGPDGEQNKPVCFKGKKAARHSKLASFLRFRQRKRVDGKPPKLGKQLKKCQLPGNTGPDRL
jgi:hypothetical protein